MLRRVAPSLAAALVWLLAGVGVSVGAVQVMGEHNGAAVVLFAGLVAVPGALAGAAASFLAPHDQAFRPLVVGLLWLLAVLPLVLMSIYWTLHDPVKSWTDTFKFMLLFSAPTLPVVLLSRAVAVKVSRQVAKSAA